MMLMKERLLTTTLRRHGLGPQLAEVAAAALAAADPEAAVRRTLHREGAAVVAGGRRIVARGRVVVGGAGKAGGPMALAAREILGPLVAGGLVVVKDGHRVGGTMPVELREAGHPLPDERGAAAASALGVLADQLGPDDLLLLLLSGGGSALLTLPAPGLSLADLRATTDALLRCGAPITALNTLRKHLTQLGGGQLARRAAPAPVAALVLSDVLGSPLDVIASGPVSPDPTTFSDALSIVGRYGLEAQLPSAVVHCLRDGAAGLVPETPKPDDLLWRQVSASVIADNGMALDAAARAAEQLGWRTEVVSRALEGEAGEAGRWLASVARERAAQPGPRPLLLLAGGETTVTVRGPGRGGRNQELALAAAQALDGGPEALLLALATDGGDGPTDAAGAVVDQTSAARAAALGLDLPAHLAANDSYPLLDALGDLLRPGPTLTNVNDLALALIV